jgi:hypothetical protein
MRISTVLLAGSLAIAGCGGSSSSAPTESSGPRPVRVDSPTEPSAESETARPTRVAPVTAGEAAESDDLAAPPPVEAPTGG